MDTWEFSGKVQVLTYAAGIDMYEARCREKRDAWERFMTTKASVHLTVSII